MLNMLPAICSYSEINQATWIIGCWLEIQISAVCKLQCRRSMSFFWRGPRRLHLLCILKSAAEHQETFNWKIMETINVCDIIADQEGSGLLMEFYGSGCKLHVVRYARCTP